MLAKFFVVTLVIAASPRFLGDIAVGGSGAAMKAALIYGLLIVFVGWGVTALVTLLSIVPGILTLGLFFLLVPLIVNAVLLKMTAGLIGGFAIGSWTSAILLSALLSIVNVLFEKKKSDS